MRLIKLFSSCAIALCALVACTGSEPEDKTSTYDEAYYAANASISSGYSEFSATEQGGSVLFGPDGGSVVIKVNCGTDWTVGNTASDLFETEISDGSLTISAEPNRSVDTISGVITLYTAGSRITFATITVSQEAYDSPEITAETTSWHAPALGELTTEIAISVRSGELAVYSVSEDWLTATVTDNGVSLTAQGNGVADSRSAEVMVANTVGTLTDYLTISVTQDPRAYISLDSSEGNLLPAGGTLMAGVETNFDWICTTSDSWLTAAGDGSTLTVTATENNTEDDRTGTVTLTCGDGAENYVETTYTVIQMGGADPLILEYTTTVVNTKITLPLDGTVDCNVYWGDGSVEAVTSPFPSHLYERKGTYEIWVNGTVTALNSWDLADMATPDTHLTAVKAWGATGLTDMSWAFTYCEGLKTIPTDSVGSFSEVTSFEGAFNECHSLQSIPEGLLNYAEKATTMRGVFAGCYVITSVPAGIFDHCPLNTSFSYVFYFCKKLASIPDGLFDNCPEVTTFDTAFYECLALTSVPKGLFDKNTKVENFSWAFAWCENLASIPEGLFDNCPDVTDFSYVFYLNYPLEKIPDHLFDKNTKAASFSHAFSYSDIKTVPESLFDYCPDVTEMDHLFYNCNDLATVPDDLFKYNTKVTTFERTFCKCYPLTSVQPGIFDSCPDVTNFFETFAEDSALTCESPYTALSDGSKIHLYNRLDSEYNSIYPNVTEINSEDCFLNCTGLTDYDSIPAAWGGGSSTSSVTATATRTADLCRTAEPLTPRK